MEDIFDIIAAIVKFIARLLYSLVIEIPWEWAYDPGHRTGFRKTLVRIIRILLVLATTISTAIIIGIIINHVFLPDETLGVLKLTTTLHS